MLRGTALYRAGRFDEAVQQLTAGSADGAEPAARAWLFLAMAHERLGHTREAGRWLDRAIAWLDRAERAGPKAAPHAGRLGDRDWPALFLLRREATERIRW